MQKFIGKYAVYLQKLENNKSTTNKYDNYLKHKTGQIYRYSKDTLALSLLSTNAKNKYLTIFESNNLPYKILIDGDFEGIYLINEKDAEKLFKIIKPLQKGKHKYPNFEE